MNAKMLFDLFRTAIPANDAALVAAALAEAVQTMTPAAIRAAAVLVADLDSAAAAAAAAADEPQPEPQIFDTAPANVG